MAWFAGRRLNNLTLTALLPLLLNLVWLLDPAVELARGRFLFAAGWWLVAVLVVHGRLGESDRRWRRVGPLFVAVALLPVYLATMASAVGAADTFEFQVVAPQLGIAHPTGYPLYLLLGKLFSLLPLGTVAWRLNLASAVYAVVAAALVFRIGLDLLRRPLPALVGAIALGLAPIYWSQAIVAEVYALHALIVALALWLMVRLTTDGRRQAADRRKAVVGLTFLIGLGLTNHLTTVFLIPPAALAVALRLLHDEGEGRRLTIRPLMRFWPAALAFLVPLLLYLYLPLRWQAVNGEPMGAARFIEWVIGGRFQGALQWAAWLRDPARWAIIGRLLFDAWGWVYLALAAIGLVWLVAVSYTHLDVYKRQVEIIAADDALARPDEAQQGIDGGHARRKRQGETAALQRRQRLLQRGTGRVGGAGVVVAAVLVHRRLGVGGRLVDGRHNRARSRVGFDAGMDGEGGEAISRGLGHRISPSR